MLTVAVVKTGTKKYSIEDVLRVHRAVTLYLRTPFRFVCITDLPNECEEVGIEPIPVGPELPGWWAKMKLFDRSWRDDGRLIYFDLDTLICGELDTFATLDLSFGICANFTRAIKPEYPCRYGSCIMTMSGAFGDDIWGPFIEQRKWFVTEKYGDQKVIERLHPHASFIQEYMWDGWVLGYRDVRGLAVKPNETSLVVYAGKRSPNTMGPQWAKELWNKGA